MATDPANQDGIFDTLQSRYDAISVYEAMNYLFKKSIGYPNYFPQGPLYGEIVTNYNSFPFINKNKIYNQPIPQSNLPFNNYIEDPTFSNITFRFQKPSFSVRPDRNAKRYYSSNYPYIVYYSNVLLTNVADYGIPSIYGDINQTVAFSHPLLVNSIPVTQSPYDNGQPGAYSVTLLTSNIGNQSNISQLDGYWLVDTDSGVLTLYDSNTNVKLGIQYDDEDQVIRSGDGNIVYNLPRISFYRYEGLIGSTDVASTQNF
jgi:hypothetical protein